jgi:hypothetical protein
MDALAMRRDLSSGRAALNRTAKSCGPGVKAVFAGENAYPQSQGTTKGTVSQIDTAEYRTTITVAGLRQLGWPVWRSRLKRFERARRHG